MIQLLTRILIIRKTQMKKVTKKLQKFIDSISTR